MTAIRGAAAAVTGVQVGQSNVVVFDRAGAQIVSLNLTVERDTAELSAMIARLVPDSNVDVEIVSDNVVRFGGLADPAWKIEIEGIAVS